VKSRDPFQGDVLSSLPLMMADGVFRRGHNPRAPFPFEALFPRELDRVIDRTGKACDHQIRMTGGDAETGATVTRCGQCGIDLGAPAKHVTAVQCDECGHITKEQR